MPTLPLSAVFSHLLIDEDPDAAEEFGRVAVMLGMFPSVEEVLQGNTEKAPPQDMCISIGYAIASAAAFDLKCEHERLITIHGPVLPLDVLATFQTRIENLLGFLLNSTYPELAMMVGKRMIAMDHLPVDTNRPNFKQFVEMYCKQVIES